MRHVFASRPVSARALGMREPPSTTGLVTGSRRALATPPRMRAAIPSAVNLAAIATTTNQRLGPTPSAQKQPGRSSVVMVGLADAMWTSAQLSAILIGHACPARCGARRRAEPASRDRRRACPGEGQAYPNIRRYVRAHHAPLHQPQPRTIIVSTSPEEAAKLTTAPSMRGFPPPSTPLRE